MGGQTAVGGFFPLAGYLAFDALYSHCRVAFFPSMGSKLADFGHSRVRATAVELGKPLISKALREHSR
jgi:hypothetical protein